VVLVNDTAGADPANADELDAKTFGGKAMTYYGRWTTSTSSARRRRRRRAHRSRDGARGYGFNVVQGKTGEQFDLVTPD